MTGKILIFAFISFSSNFNPIIGGENEPNVPISNDSERSVAIDNIELITKAELWFDSDSDLENYDIYHQVVDRVNETTKYVNKRFPNLIYQRNQTDSMEKIVILHHSETGLKDNMTYIVFRQTPSHPKHYTGHLAYIRKFRGQVSLEWDILSSDFEEPQEIFAAAFTPYTYKINSIFRHPKLAQTPLKEIKAMKRRKRSTKPNQVTISKQPSKIVQHSKLVEESATKPTIMVPVLRVIFPYDTDDEISAAVEEDSYASGNEVLTTRRPSMEIPFRFQRWTSSEEYYFDDDVVRMKRSVNNEETDSEKLHAESTENNQNKRDSGSNTIEQNENKENQTQIQGNASSDNQVNKNDENANSQNLNSESKNFQNKLSSILDEKDPTNEHQLEIKDEGNHPLETDKPATKNNTLIEKDPPNEHQLEIKDEGNHSLETDKPATKNNTLIEKDPPNEHQLENKNGNHLFETKKPANRKKRPLIIPTAIFDDSKETSASIELSIEDTSMHRKGTRKGLNRNYFKASKMRQHGRNLGSFFGGINLNNTVPEKRLPINEENIEENVAIHNEGKNMVIQYDSSSKHPEFEDRSSPFTGILDCNYENVTLSSGEFFKFTSDKKAKLVSFLLKTLRAQCLNEMKDNTVGLFLEDLVTLGNDMKANLNMVNSIYNRKTLSKTQWDKVISAIYFVIYTDAYRHHAELISSGATYIRSPDALKISLSVRTLTTMITRGMEVIRDLEAHAVKISKSLIATLNERYLHSLKEASLLKSRCSDCFEEEDANYQDRIQLRALKEFVIFGIEENFEKKGPEMDRAFVEFYQKRLPILTG